VRMKLYKGFMPGRRAANPKTRLYDRKLATYEQGDTFSHESAAGFNKIFGLGLENMGS